MTVQLILKWLIFNGKFSDKTKNKESKIKMSDSVWHFSLSRCVKKGQLLNEEYN